MRIFRMPPFPNARPQSAENHYANIIRATATAHTTDGSAIKFTASDFTCMPYCHIAMPLHRKSQWRVATRCELLLLIIIADTLCNEEGVCNGGDDNDIHSVIALLSRFPRARRRGGSLQRYRTDGRTDDARVPKRGIDLCCAVLWRVASQTVIQTEVHLSSRQLVLSHAVRALSVSLAWIIIAMVGSWESRSE